MVQELYDDYVEAKRAVRGAEEWNALPDGPIYESGGKMDVAISHSTAPMLMRIGQQNAGGKNYWESPSELNAAILYILVREQDEIIEKAISYLKREEEMKLIKAQRFVDELQDKINSVKGGAS
jgi:hypothetical protein